MLKNEGSIWELTSIVYEFSDKVRIGKRGLWNKQVYLSVFKKHVSLSRQCEDEGSRFGRLTL
jgi:hypothetical protein